MKWFSWDNPMLFEMCIALIGSVLVGGYSILMGFRVLLTVPVVLRFVSRHFGVQGVLLVGATTDGRAYSIARHFPEDGSWVADSYYSTRTGRNLLLPDGTINDWHKARWYPCCPDTCKIPRSAPASTGRQ